MQHLFFCLSSKEDFDFISFIFELMILLLLSSYIFKIVNLLLLLPNTKDDDVIIFYL